MGNYWSSLETKLCENCAKEHRNNWPQNKRVPFLGLGSEPIPYVVLQEHPQCLKVLLEAKVMKDKDKTWKRICDVALIYATCHAHAECMELLIDAGADVHQPLNDPLLITARFGHAKCLELLIRKGANVNRPIFIGGGNGGVDSLTFWCNTPLRAASKYDHTKCVEILLKARARVNSNTVVSLIIDSVSTCSDHTLRVLLAAGADVNAVDSHNNTPLIFASEQKINCVKILLEAKAKINMFIKKKKNALCNHVEKHISQKKSPEKTMVLLLCAAGKFHVASL